MERKLATIREVSKVLPIEKADRLELAIIDGWQCVVKKNEVKPGDAVIYIEIDSIVPDIPYFDFMKERKFRVKTIKLRGQISQGLAVPITEEVQKKLLKNKLFQLGHDVSDVIGITKWIPPSEREVYQTPKKPRNPIIKFLCRYNWFRKLFPAKARKIWPSWIQKTDEERIQNCKKLLEIFEGEPCIITEKLDGQSATYFVEKSFFGYKFGVCSRNIWLQMSDNSTWWTIAKNLNVKKYLIDLAKELKASRIVLQGEIVGPGVANGSGKNIYNLDKIEFKAFNLLIDGKKTNYSDMKKYLFLLCECVPCIYYALIINDLEHYLKLSQIQSKFLPGAEQEGIVVRDVETNGAKFSFKAINNNFLLKHDL